MKTTLKTHVACSNCERRCQIVIRCAEVRDAQSLRDVADLMEQHLQERGWEFAGGEFETPDSGVRYYAGIW